MQTRMRFDDVAWEASETISDSWVAGLFQPDTLRSIGDFMIKHRSGVPTELRQPRAGTFNVSFWMKFDDGGSALIRFPKPGTTMFPEEKVPFILHWGTREESPLGLGPFILMEYVEHAMDLGEALNTPTLGVEDRPILDPAVDVEKLEMLFGQLADIVLQLSQCSLPRIGSLVQVDDFTWEPGHRPLSIGMNELIRLGTLPRSKLPTSAFETASEYYSADDCRRRFVARRLFSRVTSEGRFASSRNDHGPFKLWCDDLRPSNILLNEHLQIVGVIDWEFTYAAPVQFSYAPPWWLLLEQPEAFEYRLQRFLKSRLKPDQRLSGPMRQSWENSDFWVTYAARKSFAFDMVFWKKLDPRFFGSCAIAVQDRWKERLGLLSEEETRCMEQIVSRKVGQMKTRELAWEPEEMP
ncbi:phosphotransferase family protein [Aspergillus violaceofuscus CBS 115571]|uniref:Phosphotransferase family protein n=1 Tax=Aspergillus violaceofuscus (strain CBS 115571) TaxID=1450538 RepID=A0A2V5H731_ASPV1|nr:phosphotransferase family protein [Aspergillus violaceofuscus CBS 115571]